MELHSDTRALAWHLGYKLSRKPVAIDYLFINTDARHGTVIYLQRGNASQAAIVLLHGGLGTPVATQLQPYMPPTWPLLTLQAPELVH